MAGQGWPQVLLWSDCCACEERNDKLAGLTALAPSPTENAAIENKDVQRWSVDPPRVVYFTDEDTNGLREDAIELREGHLLPGEELLFELGPGAKDFNELMKPAICDEATRTSDNVSPGFSPIHGSHGHSNGSFQEGKTPLSEASPRELHPRSPDQGHTRNSDYSILRRSGLTVFGNPEGPTQATGAFAWSRFSLSGTLSAKGFKVHSEKSGSTSRLISSLSAVSGRLKTISGSSVNSGWSSQFDVTSAAFMHNFSQLTAKVREDLLRGVVIGDILGGCGRSLQSSTGTMKSRQEDFAKSRPTEWLDDFISHTWVSSPKVKFLALCTIYNGPLAVVCSHIAAIGVAILEQVTDGPNIYADREDGVAVGSVTCFSPQASIACRLLCPLIFVLIFLFGQSWKRIWCRCGRLVFFDKFCVDQESEERKRDAIRGLGGFLNSSTRLVILWSPAFFTRMWCIFEVATWLHLDRDLSDMLFMPMQRAEGITTIWVTITAMVLWFAFVGDALDAALTGCVATVGILILVHRWRKLTNEMCHLPRQLQEFSLDHVRCHCCSCNHVVPGTDQVLQCDRDLVLNTLTTWFAPLCEAELRKHECTREEILACFERSVQRKFGRWVLKSAGPLQCPYWLVVIASSPLFWWTCDVCAGAATWPNIGPGLRLVVGEQLVHCFFTSALSIKLGLFGLLLCDKAIGKPKGCIADFLVSCFCTFINLCLVAFFWLTPRYLRCLGNIVPLVCWDACIILSSWVAYGCYGWHLLPKRVGIT